MVQYPQEERGKKARAVYVAKDIRDLTGLSLPTVYDLMNRADFPSIMVGQRRKIVPIEAFHRWLDEQATKGMK